MALWGPVQVFNQQSEDILSGSSLNFRVKAQVKGLGEAVQKNEKMNICHCKNVKSSER